MYEVELIEKRKIKYRIEATNYFQAIDAVQSGYGTNREEAIISADWDAEEIED